MADTREDYRRQVYEDRMDSIRPDCCSCCPICGGDQDMLEKPVEEYECDEGRSWLLVDQTVYGDDADSRRGVPLYVFECRKCGNEREVIGN